MQIFTVASDGEHHLILQERVTRTTKSEDLFQETFLRALTHLIGCMKCNISLENISTYIACQQKVVNKEVYIAQEMVLFPIELTGQRDGSNSPRKRYRVQS